MSDGSLQQRVRTSEVEIASLREIVGILTIRDDNNLSQVRDNVDSKKTNNLKD